MSNLINLISQPSAQSAVETAVGSTTVQDALQSVAVEEVEEAGTLAAPEVFYLQDCKPLAGADLSVFSNRIQLIYNKVYLPEEYEGFYNNINFKKPFTYSDEVEDKLRFAAQKYWYNKENTNIKFAKTSDFTPSLEVPFEMRISAPIAVDSGQIPGIDQVVHLLPNKNAFLRTSTQDIDRSIWYAYVNGGKNNLDSFETLVKLKTPFDDYSFNHFLPINDEVPGLAKKASISVNYNFHIREFESVASLRSLPEQILPNVYAMVAHIENLAGNPHVESLNKLDGLLDDILIAQSNGTSLTFRDNAQYFNEWAKNVTETSEPWRADMQRRFGDIVFSADELENELLDIAQQRENIYPFSIQIDFSTDSTTEFTQILKDCHLSKNFMGSLMKELISDREGFDSQIEDKEFAVCKYFQDATPIDDSKNIRTWDITKWWMKLDQRVDLDPLVANLIPNSTFNVTPDSSFGAIGEINENQQNAADLVLPQAADIIEKLQGLDPSDYGTFIDAFKDPESDVTAGGFYEQLLRLIFAGKMRKFVKKHMRDYCALMAGEEAYSEPVMYRISKHPLNPVGGVRKRPIQNFYFPNTNDVDVISFVDTQVKYNKKYVYKIWSYYLVIGNQYVYQRLNPDNPNATFNEKLNTQSGNDFISLDHNNVASFRVRNKPLLMITEAEQQVFDPIQLMDDPPIAPTVEFIPYLGDDRKIGISLCNSGGETRQEPIAIEPADQKQINSILKKQKSEDGRIRFAGDDSVAFFEVFRINAHPTGYSDFQGSKIATVSTEMPSNSLRHSAEVTFQDRLRSNTKYYYIFRAVDIHGHMSNPTGVYEIELVNNSGAIYPLIRSVDFLKKEEKFVTKDFKKYLRVNVSVPQKTINLEKSRLNGITVPVTKAPDNIVLGITDESVWKKKFKIRITSKTSGKKMDINFQVDRETREINASTAALDDVVVTNPNSIADIVNTLVNNK